MKTNVARGSKDRLKPSYLVEIGLVESFAVSYDNQIKSTMDGVVVTIFTYVEDPSVIPESSIACSTRICASDATENVYLPMSQCVEEDPRSSREHEILLRRWTAPFVTASPHKRDFGIFDGMM